jgi:hypothetical protein
VDKKSILSYSAWTTAKPHNLKIGLSFGGGLDSFATHCVFSKAFLIHEKNFKHNDYTHDLIRSETYGKNAISIESNNKELCTIHGWTSWIACVATSLLVASDLKLGYIFLGSSLGSVYLNNGKKYSNTQLNNKYPNQWYKIFHQIGIPILTPMAGFSDLLLAKIIPHNSLINQVHYCILGENGNNCHKCWKCFRRDLIITYITGKSLEDHSCNYSYKDNLHIQRLLDKNIIESINEHKLPGIGPTLIYIFVQMASRRHVKEKYPEWLRKYATEIYNYINTMQIDMKFAKLFYDRSLKLFDPYDLNIKKIINKKLVHLSRQIQTMDNKDYYNLENWGH